MTTARRLTDYFVPAHYELSLDINRPDRTFDGTVTIKGTSQSVSHIVLHAKGLTIAQCLVDGKDTKYTNGENDELELACDTEKGREHVITIGFHGTISDQMHGMYPCYFDHEGEKKELIATQFESHHAREVFPCIDEPAAKATFDVTLTTETGVTVLGNMPVISQTTENDKLITTFDRTPIMSSYLLAWVYGELHKRSATTKNGVEVNIWATPAQAPASLDFALDIATRTIDFFDEYFDTAYPLPKSDHVALPDFSSGAMENWGLITYREVALLADPAATSVASKHRIAAIIAHELSHQWFGNLVTMSWWNNLWLNESFANLMEYVAIDDLQPDWNVWLDFAAYETVMSLRRDATPGVQAVQVDVNHPDEISTLFDPAIVYAKGSRLLHMLERYVGKTAFRDGLRTYFARHAYGNTVETDLWDALSSVSGKDIGALMNAWISQPGYPVVHTSKDGLRQERFFIGEHEPSDSIWPIPLGAEPSSGLPELLTTSALEAPIEGAVRLNSDDSAHFITHYSNEMMDAHLSAVTDGRVDPIGRLQLLHEQTLLSRGNLISSAAMVPLLSAYQREDSESVWDIMAVAIGELKKFVEDDEPSENALKRLAGTLASRQFARLGWNVSPAEPEADTKLRATIISLVLYSEDPAALEQAAKMAIGDIDTINPELRDVVLSSAIRHSTDSALFDRLFSMYQTTSSAELQQEIAGALASSRSESDISRMLKVMKDPSVVRSQDVARWFAYLIRSRYGRELAWQWLRDNWAWIETTFDGDKSYDDYPRYAAMGLMSAKQLVEYREFFAPLKSQRALTRVIDMGISEIEARIQLIEQDRDAVRRALLDQE